MPDDTVTTSWKRFTDKVKGLWGKPAEDHFREIAPATVTQDRGITPRPAESPAGLPHSER
jgi:hypothetical protein